MRAAEKNGTLCHRDRLLWALVAAGATNKEIGARFGFTDNNAGQRVFQLLLLLGCRNRVELAVKWHGGEVRRARAAAEKLTPPLRVVA